MTPTELLAVLDEAATAIAASLDLLDDWGLAGTREGQYRSDLAADAAALEVLARRGLGVLSEESGLTDDDASVIVVLDPVDGSTNASRRIPWFATSLCAVDRNGPAAALVRNLATGDTYRATRGGGATRNGRPISPSGAVAVADSLIGLSGYPPHYLGWRQFRALGAAALDLCAVADGTLDGYVDCSWDAHGVWDYLAGVLVCEEAGAAVGDGYGRDLCVLDPQARRTPVAAATPELLDALVAARATFAPPR
jgi:fructose-1,6-bisphosphatase/inositol monophosphatase family enzyme